MAQVQKTYRDADGVKRVIIYDETEPDKFVIRTEVQMDGVIESNKIARELHPTGSTNKLVAKGVPMTVVEQSIREQWDDSDWKKWLNDPDNAAFRIWPGRI